MTARARWSAVAAVALGLVAPATAGAADHFVSPAGTDAGPGTREAPWRTVARVNEARLGPGDTVAFAGGATFPGELAPSHAGAAGAPVTFTSYGGGRATLSGGVWLHDVAHQAFRTVRIAGAQQGILGSRDGAVTDVLIDDVVVEDVAVGINSASAANARWTIANTTVASTQDSGVILEGADMTVRDSAIARTGKAWATLAHNLHGIYAKSAGLRVLRTSIGPNHDPQGEGISTRFPGALLDGNRIHDVAYAIGSYDDAGAPLAAGPTTVRRTIAWRVAQAGVYADPGRRVPERWRIHNNTWLGGGDVALDLPPSGARTVVRNNASGGFGALLRVQAAPGLVHDHNLAVPTLGFSIAVGLPTLLGAALVDTGTAAVDDGASLTPGCDGGPTAFCGAAPDIGALESLPAPRAG